MLRRHSNSSRRVRMVVDASPSSPLHPLIEQARIYSTRGMGLHKDRTATTPSQICTRVPIRTSLPIVLILSPFLPMMRVLKRRGRVGPRIGFEGWATPRTRALFGEMRMGESRKDQPLLHCVPPFPPFLLAAGVKEEEEMLMAATKRLFSATMHFPPLRRLRWLLFSALAAQTVTFMGVWGRRRRRRQAWRRRKVRTRLWMGMGESSALSGVFMFSTFRVLFGGSLSSRLAAPLMAVSRRRSRGGRWMKAKMRTLRRRGPRPSAEGCGRSSSKSALANIKMVTSMGHPPPPAARRIISALPRRLSKRKNSNCRHSGGGGACGAEVWAEAEGLPMPRLLLLLGQLAGYM